LGSTKIGSALTINDRFARVADDGSFRYSFALSDGANALNFKATDPAGNTTEKSLSVTFNP